MLCFSQRISRSDGINAMAPHLPQRSNRQGLLSHYLSQQRLLPPINAPSSTSTRPYHSVDTTIHSSRRSFSSPFSITPYTQPSQKTQLDRRSILLRAGIIALIVLLAFTAYYFWQISRTKLVIDNMAQQNVTTTDPTAVSQPPASASTDTAGSTTIQVYVVGAVKNPGIYTLDANARVYQLLKAAGGPLPEANLVALNLAAKLSDGQEVYVIKIGETPPTYQGGVPGISSQAGGNTIDNLTNINTASNEELRATLHVSSTTAQHIIDYRTNHGLYTSVDELLQVVSKAIYDKIKDEVTI